MTKFSKHLLAVIILMASACSHEPHLPVTVIPEPLSVEMKSGTFSFNEQTAVYSNLHEDGSKFITSWLEDELVPLGIAEKPLKKNGINLLVETTGTKASPESYRLEVTPSLITITAPGESGLFYGVQSLLQSATRDDVTSKASVPALTIKDEPRFGYRGLHLDVSRHFFDTAFVKKQLDAMARYKLNRFHWHLTDGPGWRLEIKKYPLLTQKAAWRTHANWKEWWNSDRQYLNEDDPDAFGGYYTQQEAREIVAYAAERAITVIPEIEMPGHSEEVLAVYPQLSCAGEPYVNSDFCIGNEETFTFLENVLTEVMAIFPSEYIHIGGDEASKSGWKDCKKCAARMKAEGLEDVDELQSYMIHRIEKFLNAHGRRLLGWDEILEGGLAPDATVMSWRGEEGGIAAVQSGHQAIMTPGNYMYFDKYQDDPTREPEAIGGYLSLKNVYSYNPVPKSLSDEEAKLILGVQANLWTEYVPTYNHAEYMIYPRLLALAEVAWSETTVKSWPRFRAKALEETGFLNNKGYNTFDLAGETGERPASRDTLTHLALGKPVTYHNPYSRYYAAAADATLTDGLQGGWTYSDGRWQGFNNKPLDITIDLGKVMPVSEVKATFMQITGPWVWMPKEVLIQVSETGESYTMLKRLESPVSNDAEGLIFETFGWEGSTKARYVRYIAYEIDKPGAWIFTDEIVVR